MVRLLTILRFELYVAMLLDLGLLLYEPIRGFYCEISFDSIHPEFSTMHLIGINPRISFCIHSYIS